MAKKKTAKQSTVKELQSAVTKLRSNLEKAESKAERWKAKAKKHAADSAAATKQLAKAQKALTKAQAKAQTKAQTKAAPKAGAQVGEPAPTSSAAPVPLVTTVVRSETPDDTWNITRLRAAARAKGIAGYSRKPKAQLIEDLNS